MIGKRALKILFVSRDKFPPFRVDVSILFGKEMARKGHTIDWVLQSENPCKKQYITEWSGGTAYIGPTNNGKTLAQRIHKHFLRFFHLNQHIALIARSRYDVIQLKDSFLTAVVYLLTAKIFKTHFFYWLSYPVADAQFYSIKEGTARHPVLYLIRGILYHLILHHILLKYSDHIFVQSEQMKNDFIERGIQKIKMTAIPMGIEPESFNDDKFDNGCNCKPDHFIILYLGTLIRIRRIDFVIRVFEKVIKKIPNANLYLVGKGESDEDIAALKDVALKLGILDSIIFTGFLDRKNAFKIVKSADVCLSPFYPTPILNSTSPTKLIEYMALGKAVIANDHPEQKDIIKKSGGGICVPYSEEEFSQAVIYLLKHPDKRNNMGNKGKEWVFSNRTYSKIANKVEQTYLKTLG
jgi:glycosyltransferase involved in cell wall biosynthesis